MLVPIVEIHWDKMITELNHPHIGMYRLRDLKFAACLRSYPSLGIPFRQ